MGDTGYHEPPEELTPEARDIHRAIRSVMEELEAIDWYLQRITVCKDDQLRGLLTHNMNEEVEHATMGLEWLRRRIPKFDSDFRTYLFTSAPITAVEEEAEGGAGQGAAGVGKTAAPGRSLGIAGFKKGE